MVKEMEKEKNIVLENLYLKECIKMVKETEKVENMMMVN